MTSKTTTPPDPHSNGEAPPAEPFDPFDPKSLRINSGANADVESVLTTVPVRKPKRVEWFRVHPGDDHVVDTVIVERNTGMDTESYLVLPAVVHLVASELRPVRLFTAMNKIGTTFLWPAKLARGDNDRIHRIADTALLCAEQAKTLWTKMVWSSELGAYEMYRAKGDLGEPQWPDRSFRDLIEIAFRGNVIDTPDHPVIRELEGDL
jgi:hypothetical protein